MAPGQARVFDHHRVGQAAALFPFAHQKLHAPGVRQNGNERSVGKVARQFGQIQRQTGAHYQGVSAAFQRLAHVAGVLAQRLHHVDRHHALALCKRAGALNLAV